MKKIHVKVLNTDSAPDKVGDHFDNAQIDFGYGGTVPVRLSFNRNALDLGFADLGFADLGFADLGFADLGFADLERSKDAVYATATVPDEVVDLHLTPCIMGVLYEKHEDGSPRRVSINALIFTASCNVDPRIGPVTGADVVE